MEKKKVLLFAYTKVNLGDNLFIYMLTKRYPNLDFYIHVVEKDYEKVYQGISNLHYIYEPRDINNCIKIEEFDAYIYVGGSIFIESEYGMNEIKEFNRFIKRCKEQGKKFFYMSCNFGPYQTQEYLELARENFSLCDGICFRDKKSYELFQDIEKVMYAPDMAFCYKTDKYNLEKEKSSIGISVISLEIRNDLKQFEVPYQDFIKRIIIKFAKRDYKVYLFSFSEFEKDGQAIQKIIATLPEEYKNKIEVVTFNQNIEAYLEKYAKMEYMVCGRFHSMILSILFGQKIYNITYSQKQENVIVEQKLFTKYQPIKEMTFETILRKYYFKKVSKRKIKKIAQNAQKQFQNIDNWLSNKEQEK